VPAQAGAATVDANDIVSVPTRDVDVKRLSRHRAIITLRAMAIGDAPGDDVVLICATRRA
jgi:hypothetical protein